MGTILIIILAVWCGLCEFSKKKKNRKIEWY